MTFRKETYAAAAEAISVSVNSLSKLSDLSTPLKDISSVYLEKAPLLAKVNLVAGEDTIRALAAFGVEFAGAFLRLSQQRMVLSILEGQISAKTSLLGGFEKTRDAMIELMRHHNIEGVQDQRKFAAIQENYEFESGRIATTLKEIQQMVAELYAKQIPFARECFSETARVNQLIVPLLVEARMELDLSISKERYAQILNDAQSKHDENMREFIHNLAALDAGAPTL
jgi:hypothetical protein